MDAKTFDRIFAMVHECGLRGVEVGVMLDEDGDFHFISIGDVPYVDLDDAFAKAGEIMELPKVRLQ